MICPNMKNSGVIIIVMMIIKITIGILNSLMFINKERINNTTQQGINGAKINIPMGKKEPTKTPINSHIIITRNTRFFFFPIFENKPII